VRSRSAIPLLLLPLASCKGQGLLDPQGPIAKAEALLLWDATAIMLTVIVPVIAATLGFALWFRSGNARAKRRPDFIYSGAVEMVVWSIPILIIGFLGGIAWIGSHELDPAKPIPAEAAPIEVEVVSLDWKWLFIYPREGVATVNELVVPAGMPVKMRLTSQGVMNSLLVPQLGSQIYTMSGMATALNLKADRPGSYAGFSAQFSGDGFSDMRFNLRAVPPAEYSRWIAQARVGGRKLDPTAYATLAKPGKAEAGMYAWVAPGLFDTIIANSSKGSMPPMSPHDPEDHHAR